MTTDVIYATDTYSGYNASSATAYATARSTLLGSNPGANIIPGQSWDGANYACRQGPVMFNTSGVGTDSISSASLSLWVWNITYVGTNFTLEARSISAYGSLAAAWVAGASLSGKTLLAHISTPVSNAAYSTLTNDAMPANINKTGTTYILLDSSRQAAGNTPTGNEYIYLYSANQTGTTNDPYLTIVHAAAGFTLRVRRSGAWVSGAVKVRRSSAWVDPTLIDVRRGSGWTPGA